MSWPAGWRTKLLCPESRGCGNKRRHKMCTRRMGNSIRDLLRHFPIMFLRLFLLIHEVCLMLEVKGTFFEFFIWWGCGKNTACMRWKVHLRYIFFQKFCFSLLLVHACMLPLSKKIEFYGKKYVVWHLHRIIEAGVHKNGALEHHTCLKREGKYKHAIPLY